MSEVNKAVCVESKEDSTSYEIDLPEDSRPDAFNHYMDEVAYHLKESDLTLFENLLTACWQDKDDLDATMGIGMEFLKRIGKLELSRRQDKIEIFNLMREVDELDRHLHPVGDSNPDSCAP